MLRRTPQSTRTTIPCPLSTLFRSPAGIAALPATMLAATKSPLFIVLPPDLGEQAAEIATEHGPDVIVRIIAANEFFGEIEGLQWMRSEEHTSELQSLMRTSYAVFCLKKKKTSDDS